MLFLLLVPMVPSGPPLVLLVMSLQYLRLLLIFVSFFRCRVFLLRLHRHGSATKAGTNLLTVVQFELVLAGLAEGLKVGVGHPKMGTEEKEM